MEQYKHDFIEFALSRKVLKFGEFTLKSGRKSPYKLGQRGHRRSSRMPG